MRYYELPCVILPSATPRGVPGGVGPPTVTIGPAPARSATRLPASMAITQPGSTASLRPDTRSATTPRPSITYQASSAPAGTAET